MNLEQATEYFRQQYPALTDGDITAVLQISRLIPTERGQVLIRAGENRKTVYFVLKGIVRAYYIKDNGQEMTPFFWSEDLITASWESIYLDKASDLTFEVIEEGVLIETDFVEFKKLVDRSDTLRRVYLDMMETILTNTLIHAQSFQNEKPEERFQHFLRDTPEIYERISQKHMASFLGITPISFSRMKKRMGIS